MTEPSRKEQILRALAGGPLTAAELVRRLGVSGRSQITPQINELARDGFIEVESERQVTHGKRPHKVWRRLKSHVHLPRRGAARPSKPKPSQALRHTPAPAPTKGRRIHDVRDKQVDRERLDRDVAAFLEAGGVAQQLPHEEVPHTRLPVATPGGVRNGFGAP